MIRSFWLKKTASWYGCVDGSCRIGLQVTEERFCSAHVFICSAWWNPPHVVSASFRDTLSRPSALRLCEENNKGPAASRAKRPLMTCLFSPSRPSKPRRKLTLCNEAAAVSSRGRRPWWRGAAERSGRWAEFSWCSLKAESYWCRCLWRRGGAAAADAATKNTTLNPFKSECVRLTLSNKEPLNQGV